MTTLVIGGGWSGLAAAVSLIKQGHAVHLVNQLRKSVVEHVTSLGKGKWSITANIL